MEVLAERIQARMREIGMVGSDGVPNAHELFTLVSERVRSYSTVHGLVRGDAKAPTIATVAAVADALGVSVDWLLGADAFDVRAYDMGRREVADEVQAAVERAMAREPNVNPPPSSRPASSENDAKAAQAAGPDPNPKKKRKRGP